jgi:hypothetical protein
MPDPSDDSGPEPRDQNERPDRAITPELFREWRSPRFGRTNPERMNNPVWEWLVKSKLSAFNATEQLHGPSAMDAGPGWCFDRFGQSVTELNDGRTVLIAGEHEDHYDADFFIYNDVVVIKPDGRIIIFGFPREIFPPTDFHSATLDGSRIIIIGSLGYQEERTPGVTPIAIFDLETFAITSVVTSGIAPGWIHDHSAVLSEDAASITIRGGKLDRGGEDRSLVENIDDWRLHLTEWRWERLTERRWQRWEFTRGDRKPNRLWNVQQALWYQSVHWEKEFQEQMEQLRQEYGIIPNLEIAGKLYSPQVPFETMPTVEAAGVFRIKINGIVVRYVQDMTTVQMTVEGVLPQDTIDTLTSDLLGKLSAIENTRYEMKQL